jgi:hypothetical protein
LIASVNENVPACVAAGTNNGCRPNPNYGNDSQYSSLADSHYDGLQVSFLQRPVRWGNYRISYTYSKALDNVGEFFYSAPINNFKGIGNDFFSVRARLSRTFQLAERWKMEGIAEAFNALNHRNNLTLHGTFGAGAYPTNPSPAFGQITAVNDPRSVQLALRLTF